MASCVICGGSEFAPGYGGRIAPNGSNPACVACGAAERHRIVFSMYQALAPITKDYRALQFAPDNTLVDTNFKSLTFSTYDGANSLDMMNTGLPADSYDLIASTHVLEHVSNHFVAIREMIRVVGNAGLVGVCVPSPAVVARTKDWSYADPANTWHYRLYGADAGIIFSDVLDGLHTLAAVGRDSITNTNDIVYWLSLDEGQLIKVTTYLQRAQFAVVVIR